MPEALPGKSGMQMYKALTQNCLYRLFTNGKGAHNTHNAAVSALTHTMTALDSSVIKC